MSRQTASREALGLWLMGLLGALPGCTEGGPPSARPEQLEARPQPLVTVQRLADFSGSRQLVHSGPMALTQMDGYVLYFGENSRSLYRTDGTSDGTRLLRTLKWRPPSMTPDIDGWGPPPRLVVLGTQAWWLGQEGLWTTDGTPEGTRLVGTLGLPEVSTPPVVFNGALYFSSGARLYRSDGTVQGTQELAEVAMKDIPPVQAQAAGGMLYFSCETPTSGIELCKTDGTQAGTKVVTDLVPGAGSASPRILGGIAGRVVFSASATDALNPRRLYSSDGTEAGTILLHPSAAISDTASPFESGLARGMTQLAGAAYFPCQSETTGQELCRTEGTAETTQVLDLVPGVNGSAPRKPSVLGAKLYFQACDRIGADNGKCTLWSSDGSVAGSEPLRDLPPKLSSGMNMEVGLISAGDSLFFFGERADSGLSALWRTDGTSAGTRELARLTNDYNFTTLDIRRDSGAFAGKLLFAAIQADDVEHGLELWTSDGSVAGTQRVSDLTPRRGKGTAIQLLSLEERLFVAAHPGGMGQALWRVDGTSPSIRTLHTSSASLNSWLQLAPVDRKALLISANSIWVTDETPAGLHQVNLPDVAGRSITPAGARAFLAGRQLWQTDGTEAGTVLVEGAPSNVSNVSFVNGRLWFKGTAPGKQTTGLWTSTGQPGVTTFIDAGGTAPAGFTSLGALTLFTSVDDASMHELWKTDGTTAGTVRVGDVRPGAKGFPPEPLFAWKGHVYFWATGADDVTALWKTDGTDAGTVRLRAGALRRPAEYGWVDEGFIAWGDALFFAGQDVEGGRELWRTDGTESGTVRVADLVPGAGSSNPNAFLLASAEGPLVFTAYSPSKGRELWRMDTPDAMPVLVADVAEGVRSSQPEQPTMVGSTLYFQADDGTGNGLYKLRGLIADTFAPRLSCPPNQEVVASNSQGAAVTFNAATAYDDSGESLTLASTHDSGDTFPLGATSVTFSTSDSAGNPATCAFTITVTAKPEPDAGTPEPDAGSQPDAGPPTEPPPGDSGCNCQTGASSGPWVFGLLGLLLLSRRRSFRTLRQQ